MHSVKMEISIELALEKDKDSKQNQGAALLCMIRSWAASYKNAQSCMVGIHEFHSGQVVI